MSQFRQSGVRAKFWCGFIGTPIFGGLIYRFLQPGSGWRIPLLILSPLMGPAVLWLWTMSVALVRRWLQSPWRSWFQLSLRSLIGFVIVVCIALAWVGRPLLVEYRQRQAIEGVYAENGYVTEFADSGGHETSTDFD